MSPDIKTWQQKSGSLPHLSVATDALVEDVSDYSKVTLHDKSANRDNSNLGTIIRHSPDTSWQEIRIKPSYILHCGRWGHRQLSKRACHLGQTMVQIKPHPQVVMQSCLATWSSLCYESSLVLSPPYGFLLLLQVPASWVDCKPTGSLVEAWKCFLSYLVCSRVTGTTSSSQEMLCNTHHCVFASIISYQPPPFVSITLTKKLARKFCLYHIAGKFDRELNLAIRVENCQIITCQLFSSTTCNDLMHAVAFLVPPGAPLHELYIYLAWCTC